jgi:hypothetical protein
MLVTTLADRRIDTSAITNPQALETIICIYLVRKEYEVAERNVAGF